MADASPARIDAVLSVSELRALSAQGVIKSYAKNTIIVSEGDDADTFFIVVAGRVKVYVSDDGIRDFVLRTMGPGEFFGEMILVGQPRAASVMATEAVRLVVIPKKKFQDFILHHPQFSLRLIEQLIARIHTLTESVKGLALTDVYGRVVRLLLNMAKQHDGKLVILEKLTQQDFANRVGASREMISKIFKDLVAGDYIRIDHKRITINKNPPRFW
jgi:CRP/FNR family transcriptional regulator, cyclic AMP receptor protein